MRFPWTKVETRASYSDALTAYVYAQASGSTGLVRSKTAAVAAAAGWWGRAFKSASLTPGVVGDAFTPQLRGAMGRQLVLRGEAIYILNGEGGCPSRQYRSVR